MKRIGVVANCRKEHAGTVLRQLSEWAESHGLSLVVCDETAELLPVAEQVSPEKLAGQVEAIMALGGDGTMLRTVHLLTDADTPVIGVNLGSLGFMTSVTEDELERAVQVLVNDEYVVSTRSLIDSRIFRGDQELFSYTSLNDIVVGWGTTSRVSTLGLTIDGEDVARYACDGMIVSTPTGSTGHSLSAWGPIVHPESPVLLVNVICPHTLSARPLVLSDASRISIRVVTIQQNKRLLLSADGQAECALEQGDRVEVARNPQPVRFLHLPEYSYFTVLRHKLHWFGLNP